MKRIVLSLGLPVLGLLLGVATPATASAQGRHVGVVTRPAVVPHLVVAQRGYGPGYVGRPGYYGGRPVYPARPGYVARPAYGYGVGPVAGHWGWRGSTRVWFGPATVRPYAGWIWTPGNWVWNVDRWSWQDGYWAP